MAVLTGTWFDRLLDYAHDAGTTVIWGHRKTLRVGNQPAAAFWVSIKLPDRNYERLGQSLESAAFALMQELAPDPEDRPEP